MAKITSLEQAKRFAYKHIHHKNLVVDENGSIHADCDIDAVKEAYDESGIKYFVVNEEVQNDE